MHTTHKVVAGLGVIALVAVGSLGLASSAMADDTGGTPSTDTTQAAPSTSAPEATAPDAPTSASPADQPTEDATASQTPVTTTSASEPVSPPPSSTSTSDSTQPLATSARTVPVPTEWVAWAMPSFVDSTTATWPQTYEATASSDQSAEAFNATLKCGVAHQIDLYHVSDITNALIAGGHLDGSNNPAEDLADGGWGVAYFVFPATPCPIPGQACVATGAPYTEDGFPAFTAEGLDFEGGAGHALNYLVPTSGNLQGFTSASMTISSASGYQAAYRFVLYANAGSSGYTSVSAEPYFNGWTAGQTGIFTITPATLVWNSHIASGPGSQSEPISITAMAALIPNNHFISQGAHYGSTEPEGAKTVVSAITGCITYAPPVQPAPTTRQTVVTSDEVCTVNEDGTFPGGGTTTTTTTNYETSFVFDAESNSYVVGTEVQSGEPIVVTNTIAVDESCPVTVIVNPPTTGEPTANIVPQNTTPLAFTGVPAWLIWLAVVGGLLILAGIVGFIYGNVTMRIRRRATLAE